VGVKTVELKLQEKKVEIPEREGSGERSRSKSRRSHAPHTAPQMNSCEETFTTIPRRSTALDVLRCVAVVLVLSHHYRAPANAPLIFKKAVAVCQRGGWCGVDLFFVLSGFLISGLLFSEFTKYGKIRIGRFLLRRGLKIYPAFWFLLFFVVLLILIQHGAVPWMGIIREFLFITNYWPGVFDHTWSLGVEEHFYLILPFVLLGITRFTGGQSSFSLIPKITLAVMLLALVLRISYRIYGSYSFVPAGTATHLRCDSLMFGVMLSYYYRFHRGALAQWVTANRRFLVTAACVAFGVAFVGNRGWFVMTIGFTIIAIGFGALLLVALHTSETQSPLGKKLLSAVALIGSHSYSIYLWHRLAQSAALWVAGNILTPNWLLDVALYFSFAIGIGILTSQVIEFPVLKLRDRLFPSRSAEV
jgi:peptidoglycan/LPS O-acetylase OafA/YrhL